MTDYSELKRRLDCGPIDISTAEYASAAITALEARVRELEIDHGELLLGIENLFSINSDLRTALTTARAEGYAEAIEQAAKVAKTAWLSCPYGEIADADAMNAVCEHAESGIRALGESK